MGTKSSKKIFVALIVLTLASAVAAYSVFAAMPRTISYQGYLTDSSGTAISGSMTMRFTIYDAQGCDPSTGVGCTQLWQEPQSGITVTAGNFNAIIGSLNPITVPFDNQYYLGVKVSTDPEMKPLQQLTSVGSAFRAITAETALQLSCTGCVTQTMLASGMTFTPSGHTHSGGDITTGTVAIANGGTNAATASGARTNLGAAAGGANSDITSLSGLTIPLSVPQGGTGSNSRNFVYLSGDAMSGPLSVTSSATGTAGSFVINNTLNANPALYAATNGSGPAGAFDGNVSVSGAVNAASFSGSGAGLTSLDPTRLTAGTANINIAGSAGAVTNGVYTNGNYYDPLWIKSLSGSKITSLSGDKITSGYVSASYIDIAIARASDVAGTYATQSSLYSHLTDSTNPHLTTAAQVNAVSKAGDTMTGPLSITSSGSGTAGSFIVSNSSSTRPALYATTNGSAPAGKFDGDVTVNGTASVSGLSSAGTATANKFVGDGSALTGIPMANVNGTLAITNGGTGIATGPSSSGQVLRATGANAWSAGNIQPGDLPSLSGTYIDLSSGQTISGAKTFSSPIVGNITGNAANVTGTVAIANGGTGAGDAATARTSLGAAASGANSDITSLSGLTSVVSTATGTGKAGSFQINNTSSTANALYALTNGTKGTIYSENSGTSPNGSVGLFRISNAQSPATAFVTTTMGTGYAASFTINNLSNIYSAVSASTSGTGYALSATGGSNGKAGTFNGAVDIVGALTTTGSAGIGTTTPQATLDINGYARLVKYSSQPVACDPAHDGTIALTHLYTVCVCNGAAGWVLTSDGSSFCSW